MRIGILCRHAVRHYVYLSVESGRHKRQPFVLTFQHMGITFAASILNFVPLTASLSAINSDVFGVGRMLNLRGMAERGARRKFCQNVTPWYSVVTVLVMTIALLFAVYLNYIMRKTSSEELPRWRRLRRYGCGL